MLSFLIVGIHFRYRDAGREVIAVLNEFSPCVEKASIDEAYLDLTEVVEKRATKVKPSDLRNTFVVGYPDENGKIINSFLIFTVILTIFRSKVRSNG